MSLMNKKWPSHFAYHGHPVPGLICSHHHLSLKAEDLDLEGRELVSSLANASHSIQFYLLRPWAYPCTFKEAVRERPYEIPPNCRILAFL